MTFRISSILLLIFAGTTGVHAQEWQHTRTIGVLDGPESHVFGEIRSTLLVPGRVLVLDRHSGDVRVFSWDGGIMGRVGRRGSGPGEFRDAVRIALVADSLAVLDRALQRISIFAPAGDGFEYARTIHLDFAPSDMCVTRDGFALLVFRDGRVVHYTNREGRRLRSAGGPPQTGHELLRQSLSDGLIACAAEDDLVATVFKWVPELRVLRADTLVVTYRLPGFRPVGIAVQPGGSVLWSAPEAGYDQAISLRFEGSRIHVQVGHLRRESRAGDDFSEVASYVGAATGGPPLARSVNMPWLTSVAGNRALAVQQSPMPHLLILDRHK
jgi:hypothetical protein